MRILIVEDDESLVQNSIYINKAAASLRQSLYSPQAAIVAPGRIICTTCPPIAEGGAERRYRS